MFDTDLDAMTASFYDYSERELFINYLGYNNFEYILPIRHFRTQSMYSLHIVLEGSGTLVVGDNKYNPQKGDMFFIPPDVRFCYYPDEDNLWKYVWIEFQGENAPLYATKMGFSENQHLLRCRDFSNIELLFYRLFGNYQRDATIGYYDVLSVFYRILDANLRVTDNKPGNIVDAVIDYMQCHYHNPGLSIPEISQNFNISHSYLCKLFQEANHCSAKNYLIQIRIFNACKLLETTMLSIKEIAFSVGFTDEIHFMKTFKKTMGQTPTQYRQSREIE